MCVAVDAFDTKALTVLTANGRVSWSELAASMGLSAPAAAERVRKLEESGVIKGYTAVVDPKSLGLSLTAFVAVNLEKPIYRGEFLEKISALYEVQECHHIAGDYDYLLKILCRDTAHLDRIISDEIKGLAGVARTRTTIALSTAKDAGCLSIPTNLACGASSN